LPLTLIFRQIPQKLIIESFNHVVIVGDRDPVKRLYVAPLQRVRKDWAVIEIGDAGHLNCVVKAQFKEEIAEWLDKQARR